MSEENIELARRAILGWNENGIESLIAARSSPSCDWWERAQGSEIDAERAWLITVPDGKAALVETLVDKHEARRAAGLPD